MPFLLIRGTFHVVGKSPDGDTLGFSANKKSNWKKLDGRQPKFNMKGKGNITNLRFEASDTFIQRHISCIGNKWRQRSII